MIRGPRNAIAVTIVITHNHNIFEERIHNSDLPSLILLAERLSIGFAFPCVVLV
jgi:hypothetical protein